MTEPPASKARVDWTELLRDLRESLATAFPHPEQAERIVEQMGGAISKSQVRFVNRPRAMWHSVLRQTLKRDAFPALLEAIRQETEEISQVTAIVDGLIEGREDRKTAPSIRDLPREPEERALSISIWQLVVSVAVLLVPMVAGIVVDTEAECQIAVFGQGSSESCQDLSGETYRASIARSIRRSFGMSLAEPYRTSVTVLAILVVYSLVLLAIYGHRILKGRMRPAVSLVVWAAMAGWLAGYLWLPSRLGDADRIEDLKNGWWTGPDYFNTVDKPYFDRKEKGEGDPDVRAAKYFSWIYGISLDGPHPAAAAAEGGGYHQTPAEARKLDDAVVTMVTEALLFSLVLGLLAVGTVSLAGVERPSVSAVRAFVLLVLMALNVAQWNRAGRGFGRLVLAGQTREALHGSEKWSSPSGINNFKVTCVKMGEQGCLEIKAYAEKVWPVRPENRSFKLRCSEGDPVELDTPTIKIKRLAGAAVCIEAGLKPPMARSCLPSGNPLMDPTVSLSDGVRASESFAFAETVDCRPRESSRG